MSEAKVLSNGFQLASIGIQKNPSIFSFEFSLSIEEEEFHFFPETVIMFDIEKIYRILIQGSVVRYCWVRLEK